MSPKLNSLNLFIFSPVPGRCEPLCVHLHPSSWSSHSSLPWRKGIENMKTYRKWKKICSLEGDEDFLISNRHPNCLAILNSSRHRYGHLRLLLDQMLAIHLQRFSKLNITPSFYGWPDHDHCIASTDSYSKYLCLDTSCKSDNCQCMVKIVS